jgi:hypothetical protein
MAIRYDHSVGHTFKGESDNATAELSIAGPQLMTGNNRGMKPPYGSFGRGANKSPITLPIHQQPSITMGTEPSWKR